MITYGFIEKFKKEFVELDYRPDPDPDFEQFMDKVYVQLSRCKDRDVKKVMRHAVNCISWWNKILLAYKKKFNICKNVKIADRKNIKIMNTNEFNNSDTLAIFDDAVAHCKTGLSVKQKNGEFAYSKFLVKKNAFYKNQEKQFQFKKKGKKAILKDNKTNFEVCVLENYIGVFEKEYIAELEANEPLDEQEMVAKISVAKVSKKKNIAYARINYLLEVSDQEKYVINALALILMQRAKFDKNRKSGRLI